MTNPPAGDERPDRVAVGRINAPWGVRGHVKVTALTSNPERLVEGSRVYVAGEPRTIRDVKHPRGFPCIQFEGVTTPEAAERLRGALIEIDEADLPPLGEDEYYVHDLVGLRVVTSAGEEIGTLDDVLETGSNDVYLVKRSGQKDVLVPAIDGVVLEVNLEAGTVTIEVVPGLID
ncbi:MAG: ribosome maturation factor RimM [Dehalococcoidia bacterium]